ncbi:MAG: BrnA antitoxin family protein [Terracidiphilus sp.]
MGSMVREELGIREEGTPLSPKVNDHFKATCRGWQTRMDGVLLESIKRGMA